MSIAGTSYAKDFVSVFEVATLAEAVELAQDLDDRIQAFRHERQLAELARVQHEDDAPC